MNLTIKSPHFSTIVAPDESGFYDLTLIARELRLDFPESMKQSPSDWLKVNSSGISEMKQVHFVNGRILGTLMAVYVYIDWINSHAQCITKRIQVFPDCSLKVKKRSTRESLDFVEATLEDLIERVCSATHKSFESDKPTHNINENLDIYDNSIHLKSMLKHMLAILHDSSATSYAFDQFHHQ
ncbi:MULTISPECIES: hypothetical protein [unclassified Pseudoalteromonas]|uniref:hypothetical protein n=1 Tax=unclassified Pseudoalteromonas TaxID=194690 RepID=UPI003014CA12